MSAPRRAGGPPVDAAIEASGVPVFGPAEASDDITARPALIEGSDIVAVAIRVGVPSMVIETSRPVSTYGGGPLRVAAEHALRGADGWTSLPVLNPEEAAVRDRVEVTTTSIDIEGEDTPLRVVRDGERWIGRAYHDGWRITIEAEGREPAAIRLRRIDDH